jgi:threonine dehydrogenase-like Zn-dependent dehydrogenase
VAVWGTGPVGLFAIQSAKVLCAERIIAIETVPERIAMARKAGATDIINFACRKERHTSPRIQADDLRQDSPIALWAVGMERRAPPLCGPNFDRGRRDPALSHQP